MNKIILYLILFFLGTGLNNTYAGSSYVITASAGPGGTISYTGNVSVPAGRNIVYNIMANSGYDIIQVLVDDKAVVLPSTSPLTFFTYVFTGVTASHVISATFDPSPFATSPEPEPTALPTSPEQGAPNIIIQPVNATVTAPATATFTVGATGILALSYQWMQEAPGGTGGYTAITGATSASYTTPATTISMNGTQYECIVTNADGYVTSNPVVSTVNSATAFFIKTDSATQGNWQTAYGADGYYIANSMSHAPSYASFSVSGDSLFTWAASTTDIRAPVLPSGGGTATCYYSSKSFTIDVNMTDGNIHQVSLYLLDWDDNGPRNETVQVINPANGAILQTNNVSSFYNPGKYLVYNVSGHVQLVVTNNVASSNAVVSGVFFGYAPAPIAPKITTQPANTLAVAPATATFTVAAIGTPAPTYQWMQEVPGTSTFTAVTGATSASYTTPATTTSMNGTQYEGVIKNTAGFITSNPAVLTVTGPLVVTMTSPANGSYWISTVPIILTVNASEVNGTIVQVNYLYYEGASSYQQIASSTTPPSFSASTNLPIGGYRLVAVAIDNHGNSTMTSRTSIAVTGPPTVAIVSPVNQSILTSGSVNITALASESGGGIISNVTFYNGKTIVGTVTSPSQAFTYTWPNILAGTYDLTAVATDAEGNTVTSAPVVFTVNSVPFTYAVDNNIATKTDARNNTTSYQYDNDNRLLKTTFADNSTVSYIYDPFGNQTYIIDQRSNKLTKTYDAYERLISTEDPLKGTTQFRYDANGNLLTLTDANNHATNYTYDADNRIWTQTNAMTFVTTFTYDPNGNVATRQDANGITTKYIYDPDNRLTNTLYPDNSSIVNVYDAVGRKTSMTDLTGQTIYTYDNDDRLLTKKDPAGNVITYTYDGEGDRLTIVDQNGRTITNTYDNLNRLSTVKDPIGTTTYGYDADSNKTSVAMPNGVTEGYTYDSLNRVLTDVNEKGATVISSYANTYDIAGMIMKKAFADGSWTAYSYDVLNHLWEETKQTNSGIIYDYVYTYDPVGNRLTWTKNTTLGGFWNTDYLNMPSQVLSNMTNGGYGNTANSTQAVNLTRTYIYDKANRLRNWNYAVNIYSASFPVQTDTYTYDNNGNRWTKQAVLTGEESTPQQTNYSYDFENRLNQLQYTNIPNITSTQTDNLIYNGEGLRVQALLNNALTAYLYDGSNILIETNGTNSTKTYTRGLDQGGGIGSLINQSYTSNNTAVTQYYDYNDLGSPSDLTSSTGAVADSYSYDAYGNLLTTPAANDTNRYFFSTKESDSRSGLEYFGGRYYDPEIGRWLTPDPLGFVNGPNLYLYCLDNPINFVDPYGLEIERQIYGFNFNPEGALNQGIDVMDEPSITSSLGEDPILIPLLGIEDGAANVAKTYSDATLNSFQRILEKDGVESLQKAQQTIQANLDQHLKDLEYYQNTGGFTSSVEKEIKTFKSQLDAIKDILKGVN